MLHALTAAPLDDGTEHFQPSSLQVTTIDIGNPATNIAPGLARATFNIRFNDLWSSATLRAAIERKLAAVGGRYRLAWEVSGESFLVPPGPVSECLAAAIGAVTGQAPELSTTGGTSDARFIQAYCPVAEFGLVGQTMHKADERVDIGDITRLAAIYETFLDRFFGSNRPAFSGRFPRQRRVGFDPPHACERRGAPPRRSSGRPVVEFSAPRRLPPACGPVRALPDRPGIRRGFRCSAAAPAQNPC